MWIPTRNLAGHLSDFATNQELTHLLRVPATDALRSDVLETRRGCWEIKVWMSPSAQLRSVFA